MRTEAGKRLLDEYPGVWYWSEPAWGDVPIGEAIEAEARAAVLRELREEVAGMPSGWTRPGDQFGPAQYEWLYKTAVLAAIDRRLGDD